MNNRDQAGSYKRFIEKDSYTKGLRFRPFLVLALAIRSERFLMDSEAHVGLY
jgi:hypothetical protein